MAEHAADMPNRLPEPLSWHAAAADTGVRSMAAAVRGPWMVAAPVLGGLVIGLMARFGSEKTRGHGIPEAIEAILIGGSRMSPKVAVLKPVSSAISIGTGGPFGAEGPIIMTGGAIRSLFAQFFHLSAAERKTLLVAAAAAGMTGIFGTPVAAVLLAVELLLFEWRPRSFVPVVAAAVTAICWRPLLFGAGPLFPFAGAGTAMPWAIVPFELTRVGEVMVRDADTLPADLPVTRAVEVLEAGRHRVYPVLDNGRRPVGLVSRADALRWKFEDAQALGSVAERISDASLTVLHPENSVSHAVDLMLATDQGRIPVTDPKTGELVGLLTRKDLLQVRATVARAEGERQAYFRAPGTKAA